MFRNLGYYHRGILFAIIVRSTEAARYGIIFPLHYKHEWILSYTCRILISPMEKSLEQRKNKKKQNRNTTIFHAVNSGFAVANPRMEKLFSRPCRGVDKPCRGVDLRCREGSLCHGEGPSTMPRFLIILSTFQKNPSKNLNTPKVSLRITPKWVLTQPKPNIESN